MTKHENHWIYKLMLVLVAAIWGSGFVATDLAIDAGATPMLIIALRFLIASIIMTIVFMKYLRRISRYEIIGGIVVGLFLFLGFAFQNYGIQFTTPSKNAFLTGVNVVLVPFIYWGVYRHRPKNQAFMAALLCIVGIWLLAFQGSGKIGFNIGDGLSLVCALLFACHIVSNGYFLKVIHPIKLAILQIYVTTVLSIIGFFTVDNAGEVISYTEPSALWAILYLGLFCTCVAFLMQTIAQSQVNANSTAIVLALEAVFGTLLSVLIIHEILPTRAIYGSGLIFISILVAEIDMKAFLGKRVA